MARELKTNTAVMVCVGPFFDKTDGVTPETGLTVANCKITAIAETDDNSAPTIILDNVAGDDATNTLAHITNDDAGYYSLKLTAANLNRLGRFSVAILDAANHCPVFHEFEIITANAYDSKYSTATRSVDVVAISGDTTAANNAESFFDGTGYAGTNNVIPTVTTLTELTAAVADSVPSDGSRPSIAQGVLMLTRLLMEKSVSGTTVTVKKEDGATTSMTFTLNDGTSPTSITRAS